MSFGLAAAVSIFHESEAVLYTIWHDPLVVIGLLVIGCSAVLWFRVFSRLQKVGIQTPRSISLPLTFHTWLTREYLRQARVGRWSPWPAYLMWLCPAAGFFLVVLGLAYL